MDLALIRLDLKQPLVDGAQVGRIHRRLKDDMTVYPDPHPEITFWRGCDIIKGRPMTLLLSQMDKAVSDIVESFAPEFGG